MCASDCGLCLRIGCVGGTTWLYCESWEGILKWELSCLRKENIMKAEVQWVFLPCKMTQ